MTQLKQNRDLLVDRSGQIVRCFEGQVATKAEWGKILDCGSEFVNELVYSGCLKRIPTKQGNLELYRLSFVGALFLKNSVVFVSPKMCRGDMNFDDFQISIEAIGHYRSIVSARSPDLSHFNDVLFNGQGARFVELFRGLLRWTDSNGFHQEFSNERVRHDGAINWASTVRERLALHGESYLVYDAPIYGRRRLIPGRLRTLQAQLICDAADRFQGILPFVVGPYRRIVAEAFDVLKEGSGSKIRLMEARRLLADFQRETNIDHEIDLVRYLRSLIDFWDMLKGRQIGVLGTNAFYSVWESACRTFLQAIPGISVIDGVEEFGDVRQHEGSLNSNWLIPDIVCSDLSNPQAFFIFDAKWHRVEKPFSSADLVKQFIYERAIKPEAVVAGNFLLLPGESASVRLNGLVTIENNGVVDYRFGPIQVLELPWRSVLKKYCENTNDELELQFVDLIQT